MNKPISIAIDGPAAAGKSSIARTLAAKLGFIYVDTGAMYRAIGYYVVKNGEDSSDPSKVLPLLREISIDVRYKEGEQRIYLNGIDVSEEIRSPEVSSAASNVSAMPEVRAFLLEEQRSFARTQSVVMDGRDIGTVVLPDASVKFFLTASLEERARRRMREYDAKGEGVSFDRLVEEMRLRDKQDSERAAAPLRQADDAVLVDNTTFTKEQTVERMLGIIRERTGKSL